MITLIVGASGATGSRLVEKFLFDHQRVRVIVRSIEKLPSSWKSNKQLEIVEASLLDLTDQKLQEITKDCTAVCSCLGHNLTFQGMYGNPRKLVTDSVRRLCEAIKANQPINKVKFVLMNTAGNSNRDLNEYVSFTQKMVLGLIRILVPPHIDNEQAGDYLRTNIGQEDPLIEWVVVRPDSLINKERVTDYTAYPSPTRSAIFNAGKTSRINVANFMQSLIVNNDLWQKWVGQMPVIYND